MRGDRRRREVSDRSTEDWTVRAVVNRWDEDVHPGCINYPFFLPVAAVRLLLLTGCRQGEVRTLAWRDYRGGHLFLRDSKTGPRTVWLYSAARRLLDRLPRTRGSRRLRSQPRRNHSCQATSIRSAGRRCVPLEAASASLGHHHVVPLDLRAEALG